MLGLGVLYRVMGDPLKAYSLYGLILEKYPGQAEARIQFDLIRLRETEKYLLLARNYRQDNRIEPALENYKKALQYVLKEDFIYWEVGVFLLENKKFKEAIPYLQSAVNIKPKLPNYIKALAIALEQTGKVNQAKEYYKQVLDLNPGDATVRDDIKRINQSITRIQTGSKGISSINANERITRAQAAVYLDKNFPFFGEPDNNETGIITDIIDHKDNIAIINMVKRGIFEKYPDHTFSPKKQLTRVDLAILIDRLIQNAVLSSELSQNTNGLYLEMDDIPLHSPSYRIIKRVVSLGIMTLDKDRKFNPGRYISGREFVSAVDKVINLAQ
jgi:tetratricopeptide (TPR) repeat protein